MLEDELAHIPELMEAGIALQKYAASQFPGLQFNATDQGRFVAYPHNYVTFAVHWKRARTITVTLRGNTEEFISFDELELKSDMAGYSSFRLENVNQLAAAAMHIRRAAELYQGGRSRIQRAQRVTEG
ncbi:MAG: hypothetical protein L0H29_01490 [Sinobacteraceae bacterium]|nr:hypothetical protein [Nevskiaceae bacterium]